MKNAYALLIGIGGRNFEVTAKDAKSIYNVLTNDTIAGYKEENVILLTNEEATRENILKKLDLLIEKVKSDKNSTTIVYFSGHGIENENKIQGTKNYYIVPHGYDFKNVDQTMISGTEFSEKISQIQSNKLLVLLDCCYAAAIKDDSVSIRIKGIKEKVLKGTNRKLQKLLKKGEGRVFISSCDDNELSAILPNSENSLFTEVLLEALKGEASGSSEYVHVLDIMTHVIKEVPIRISKFNHLQRPIINDVKDLSPEYYVCLNSGQNNIEIILKDLWKNNSNLIMEQKKEYIEAYKADFEENKTDLIQIIDNNGTTIKNQVNIQTNSGTMHFQ